MTIINWFPGHMAKARREISEKMPNVDLIVEIIDARIPFSSENPLVDGLRGEKPCLKILNKSDLADPKVTALWLDYFNQQEGVSAIALSQQQPAKVKQLLTLFRQSVSRQVGSERPLHAIILGIPNVGKSSLINTLAGRAITKTGNEPAVTKAQQRIGLADDIVLFDTPGFLWPKLEPAACGYRLAITGAIKSAVIEFDDVAAYLTDFLQLSYPQALVKRFRIEPSLPDGFAILEAIANKRGFFRSGHLPDIHRAAEVVLNEYRAGTLGAISLETPAIVAKEQVVLKEMKLEKERQKAARPKKKKKRKKK